jgi:hypothetical protein
MQKNNVVNLDIDVQNCMNVLLRKPSEVVLTSECPLEVNFLAGISIDLPPAFWTWFFVFCSLFTTVQCNNWQ